jgi:hypothetical protein
VHNPVLDCEYSGQRATKRITKFDIAIGSLTGDVRYDNATAMEFFEDLLIDARGVALMLLIDNSQFETHFSFNDRFDHHVEKLVDFFKLRVRRVEEPDGEHLGSFQRLKQFDQGIHAIVHARTAATIWTTTATSRHA